LEPTLLPLIIKPITAIKAALKSRQHRNDAQHGGAAGPNQRQTHSAIETGSKGEGVADQSGLKNRATMSANPNASQLKP